MYNRQYNTRNSGRYNTPGQFIPPGEYGQGPRRPHPPLPQPPLPPMQLQQPSLQQESLQQESLEEQSLQQQSQQQQQQQHQDQPQEMDTDIKSENQSMSEDTPSERPYWMKSRLHGVKKITNRERRRRQNENLRRLLTPKNALMVLNEMLLYEQLAAAGPSPSAPPAPPTPTQLQFKVNLLTNQAPRSNLYSFCADLNIEGNTYKGYGENKMAARNSAAEQAIRDIIIKKIAKVCASGGEGSQNGEAPDEEALPMIQLASFALHKLFSEWEYEGHRVPQLRPAGGGAGAAGAGGGEGAGAGAEAGPDGAGGGGGGGAGGAGAGPVAATPKPPKELPLNAAQMHPCMLLTYMRPRLEYHELAAEGDKPQAMTFTMSVEVDGVTYVGKAANKKLARKEAATAACRDLFRVDFEPGAAANVPVVRPH